MNPELSKHNILTSDRFFGDLQAPPAGYHPTKVLDPNAESALGTLSMNMQNLWVVREKLRVITAGHANAIVALCEEHAQKKIENGEPAADEYAAFLLKLQGMVNETLLTDTEFAKVDGLFQLLLNGDYQNQLPEGMKVLAIRKGFTVIARANDVREDWTSPRAGITRAMSKAGIGFRPPVGFSMLSGIGLTGLLDGIFGGFDFTSMKGDDVPQSAPPASETTGAESSDNSGGGAADGGGLRSPAESGVTANG